MGFWTPRRTLMESKKKKKKHVYSESPKVGQRRLRLERQTEIVENNEKRSSRYYRRPKQVDIDACKHYMP